MRKPANVSISRHEVILMTVKVSIIGATGYTGSELVRILYRHPEVELVALTTRSYIGMPIRRSIPTSV